VAPLLTYITASAHDTRYTRICVASIRRWHPGATVRLLRGGAVDPELVAELARYWDVEVAEWPEGNYGWGFVKLEPLFAPGNQRFLILDSDTVMTGPILDRLEACGGQFIVDREDQTESGARQIYWDPDEAAKEGIDLPRLPCYFNTGQWVGTSGVIDRSEFDPFVDWSMPRRLRYPKVFKNGEQGILNFVVNRRHVAGKLSLDRIPLMVWPGASAQGRNKGLLEGKLDGQEGRIVHWAGFKNQRLKKLPGWALLEHFEKLYYRRIPGGEALRRRRISAALWSHRWRALRTKLNRLSPV
jgi:hypothetical protein